MGRKRILFTGLHRYTKERAGECSGRHEDTFERKRPIPTSMCD